MKKMKKLIGLLLAAVMMMALGVTAFAADTETGTITVENPIAGETYTAYKIFDVAYNDGNTTYAYTIKDSSAWYNDIKDYSGFTFTQINNSDVYSVTKSADFSAAGFAAKLKENISGKTGTPLTAAGSVVKATGLELGYYFVSSTNGALCNLTTTDPDVTIHDKNDRTFSKTADKTSVEIGEKVTFTIEGKVPSTQGFSKYTYKISDTMTEGLTFNKDNSDFSIKIDGVALTSDYALAQTGNGFGLTIDVMKLQDYVGKNIVITYQATVNENAVAKISRNSAKLEYSNDPTADTTTTTTPEEAKVYSARIAIDKYVTGDSDKKLAGAKFVLKNGSDQFYKYDSSAKEVSWVDDQDNATEVTTDDNGVAEFKGLKDGTYYLEETEAPKGYNRLTDDVDITIDGSSATEADLTSLTHTEGVANRAGSILPSTGGIGTTIFYVFGGIFVLGAAIVWITRKRMNTK